MPSPTAATLHSTHYFDVNVAARQEEIQGRRRRTVEELTTIPLLEGELTEDEIQTELDNNCQSILGYVVRWVGQGVGCSTVPDIDDVGLMEDLATLRISSQHVANWLHHSLVSEDQVREAMQRMAVAVDAQNADDAAYEPMAVDYENSIPFRAALSLVLDGRVQERLHRGDPSGPPTRTEGGVSQLTRQHRRRRGRSQHHCRVRHKIAGEPLPGSPTHGRILEALGGVLGHLVEIATPSVPSRGPRRPARR